MKVALTRIGNSRGVRLPKPILEQCGFGDEAELEVKNGAIVLKPVAHPRAGWEAAIPEQVELTAEDKEWLEAPLDAQLEPWAGSTSGSRTSTRRAAPKSRRRGPV